MSLSATTVGNATNVQNNTTISVFPYTSANYVIAWSRHVDVELEFTTLTGGSSPTVQMKLQAINPLTGTVLKTYAGTVLSAAGTDSISVDGLMLGDTVNITIVVTGAPTSISGVYLRLIPK